MANMIGTDLSKNERKLFLKNFTSLPALHDSMTNKGPERDLQPKKIWWFLIKPLAVSISEN